MGTSGVEITRAAFTSTDCHEGNKANSEDSCHDNDVIADVTEKDFVKEWLWRRSDRSFSHLPGIVRDRASSNSSQSSNVIQNTLQVHGLKKPMEGHNLNFMLSRVDSRSPEQKSWSPSDYGSYYSQRSLLNSYNKEQCHWSAYCKAFVVVTIFLLLAWGIAVPLYFTVGPGTSPWNKDQIPTETEAHMSKVIGNTRPTGIVFNGVNCTLRIINQQFIHYLQNKYSKEFQSLRLEVEAALSAIFENENHFNKVVVTSFSPGSIVVRFVVLFKKKRADIKEYTYHVLVNHIMTHWSMLSTYRVDLSSIQVAYIYNKCAEANGGCSHICVWTLLGDGYECHCPSGYVLSSDDKTCFAAVLDMALLRTNPIPCGATHYQCPNGSCIPQQWICDGVRDCQMGEDENSSICSEKKQDLPHMPVALPLQQQQPQLIQKLETENIHSTQATETSVHQQTDQELVTSEILATADSSTTSENYRATETTSDMSELENDMNGSKLQDNEKVKDIKLNSPLRWFKFLG